MVSNVVIAHVPCVCRLAIRCKRDCPTREKLDVGLGDLLLRRVRLRLRGDVRLNQKKKENLARVQNMFSSKQLAGHWGLSTRCVVYFFCRSVKPLRVDHGDSLRRLAKNYEEKWRFFADEISECRIFCRA